MNKAEVKKLVDAMDWAAVWRRLDRAEKVATGIMGYPDDPRREEAAKILEIVARVRRAHKHGWSVPAGLMEQLHQLSDAANDKITRPLIEQAAKTRAGFADRTAPINQQRHDEAKEKQAAWQSTAVEIWDRHPEWSKTDVARRIARETGGNVDTIRRKLARPSRL